MGRSKYSRQSGLMSKLSVFLISAISILATTSSLIYFNVPSYIYSNIIGLFIFSLYFGTAQSLVFVCVIQIIMMKVGLATEFLGYTFVLWISDVLIIKIVQSVIPKSIFKNRKYSLILIIAMSVILMAILSKPLSIVAFNWIQGGENEFGELINKEVILDQFKIFGLSGIVTFIFYTVFDRFNI